MANQFFDPSIKSPLAGRYNSSLGTTAPGFDFSKISDPSTRDYLIYLDYQSRRQSDPVLMKQQFEALSPFLKEAADYKHKQAIEANVFASLLKDVPAAIKNYAYAGRQYDPERINIAAQPILPGSSMPNMTVNIPGRSYFR